MEQDHAFLHSLSTLGYVNLGALIFLILDIKGGWESLLFVALPPSISLAGASVYYFGWSRIFPGVAKAEGRKFMRPYLLGFYLLVAAIGLVYGLGFYAGHRRT